jgi:hypothetical protein
MNSMLVGQKNSQPGGSMSDDKLGKARSFRPRPIVERRLEDAETLGLNVSKIVNDVLENHLREYLIKEVEAEKASIQAREKRMKQLLAEPIA